MRWWSGVVLGGLVCTSCGDNLPPPAPDAEALPSVCREIVPFASDATARAVPSSSELRAPLITECVPNRGPAQVVFRYDVAAGPVGVRFRVSSPNWPDVDLAVIGDCHAGPIERACGYHPASLTGPYASRVDVPRANTGPLLVVATIRPGQDIGSIELTAQLHPATNERCDPLGPPCLDPALSCHALEPGSPTTCERSSCQDGHDNDGDGRTDYPFDPGCKDIYGDSEIDPSPVPACGDHVDNDGDGTIDFPSEPGCSSAGDPLELDDCAPGVPVQLFTPVHAQNLGSAVFGFSSPSQLRAPASCDPSGSTALSGESAWAFEIDRPVARVIVEGWPSNPLHELPMAIYVRPTDCSHVTSACAVSTSSPSRAASIELTAPAPGMYVVIGDKLGATSMATPGGILYVHAELAAGSACTPGDAYYRCLAGTACGATSHTCD